MYENKNIFQLKYILAVLPVTSPACNFRKFLQKNSFTLQFFFLIKSNLFYKKLLSMKDTRHFKIASKTYFNVKYYVISYNAFSYNLIQLYNLFHTASNAPKGFNFFKLFLNEHFEAKININAKIIQRNRFQNSFFFKKIFYVDNF